MNKKTKVVAYVSKAASEQKQEQIQGLQSQIDRLLVLAEKSNLEIVEVFKQVGNDKKELNNALEYCRNNKDIKWLLVTTPDRISRNHTEVAWWRQQFKAIGVKVKTTLPTQAEALLVDEIQKMFAQFDKEVRKLRAKRAIEAKKLKTK